LAQVICFVDITSPFQLRIDWLPRMCLTPVDHVTENSDMVKLLNDSIDNTHTAVSMLSASNPAEAVLHPLKEPSDTNWQNCHAGLGLPSRSTSMLVAAGSGAFACAALLAHSLVLPVAGIALAPVALPMMFPSVGNSKGSSRRAKYMVMQKYGGSPTESPSVDKSKRSSKRAKYMVMQKYGCAI